MNIFILDRNPVLAAQYQCNKHVVKMVLESAQILCSVRWHYGLTAPYKETHKNHPCVLWAKKSKQNYLWLVEHFRALLDEYTFRYEKRHACERIYTEIEVPPSKIPDEGLTNFVMAMPEIYKTNDVVKSYRSYYIIDKSRFAVWSKRERPNWWDSEICRGVQ